MDGQRTRTLGGGAPRLVQWFAVFTALGLAAAAAAILIAVRRADTAQAEHEASGRAQLAAKAALHNELRSADLAARVPLHRRHELDRLFRSRVLLEGIRSASLYGKTSRLTYATAPVSPAADPALREALAGNVVTRVAGTGGARRLETYVPVTLRGGKLDGVVRLDQDFAPLAEAANRTAWVITGALEGVLLLLSIVFLPMLARVSARIRIHVAELEDVATHDELTGLLNRAGFRRAVERAIAAGGAPGAVVLVDVDGFSAVNDALGSESGDVLLIEIARKLAQSLAEYELARLGEDEFGLVLRRADRIDVEIAAEGVHAALNPPFLIDGVRIAVSVSIGVAVFGGEPLDFGDILRRAGVALSAAKHNPEARVQVYEPGHEATDASHLALAAELRDGLERGELCLHYQPLVDMSSRTVRGVEALLRWNHPQRGLLPAGVFIAEAERDGLARQIRHFVFERAAQEWQEWKLIGLELELSVNLGALDVLDESLPGEIEELLARYEVPPSMFVLEITERTLVTDERRTAQVLGRLGSLGVRLAVDDFGTGYSSLASLLRFPLHQVKLDRSLLEEVPGDAAAEAIVTGSVGIAHALGATVVAEGVETAMQWHFVASIGCDIAQGYLIGPAVPAAELAALVQADPAVTSIAA